MINFQFPTPELVDQHWEEIVKYLRPAIEQSNGELTEADVHAKAAAGEIVIAIVHDGLDIVAALAYEMICFDSGKKVINIQLASGERGEEWFEHAVTAAEQLAKARGCDDIYVIGRSGWQRKLKQLGFETVHTVLHKEVK